jgi:hypothetical protein
MATVARNLQIDASAQQLVFGHTHTPLANARLDNEPWLFHNSGSFFYDYREAIKPDYWLRCWPGSALEVCDSEVTLHRLLTEDDLRDFRPSSSLPVAQAAARRSRRRRR